MEESLSLPVNSERAGRRRFFSRPLRHYRRELSSRALPLPAVLLILYVLPFTLVGLLISNITDDLAVPHDEVDECFSPQPEASRMNVYVTRLLVLTVSNLLIPFAGWVADTRIGRHSAIVFSLWGGWVGCLLQTLSQCFQFHSCSTFEMVGKYGLSNMALVLLVPSYALFQATVFAYGMDILHLNHDSTVKHRPFVYWYSWMYFASRNTSSVTEHFIGMHFTSSRLSISFLSSLFLLVSLCFIFLMNRKDINGLATKKYFSYTDIYFVLKNRLIDCCCHNESHQIKVTESNNVHSSAGNMKIKTFFQVISVLVVCLPFWISLSPVLNGLNSLVLQFKNGEYISGGGIELSPFEVFYVGDSWILLAIPLLEFFVIPVFPKVEHILMHPLRGLGFSQVLLSITIILTVIINTTAGHELHYSILFLPSILSGIAENIFFICVFEFICFHSPIEMIGMVVCLQWVIQSFGIDIGSTVSFVIMFKDWIPISCLNGNSVLSCTLWVFIILVVILLVGLALYFLIVYKYLKSREKELSPTRFVNGITVEDHFEQLISRRKQVHNHLIGESKV